MCPPFPHPMEPASAEAVLDHPPGDDRAFEQLNARMPKDEGGHGSDLSDDRDDRGDPLP